MGHVAQSSASLQEIAIDSEFDVSKCEKILNQIADNKSSEIAVRLVSSFGYQLFSELWIAILIGTICRHWQDRAQFIAWGKLDWSGPDYFQKSLPGIVALQMAGGVRAENSEQFLSSAEAFASKKRWISRREDQRSIFELDPQSVGLPELGPSDLSKRLLEFLNELEVGYRKRNRQIEVKNEISNFIRFVSELHRNSYAYARTVQDPSENNNGIRFISVRAHVKKHRGRLLSKALNDPRLYQYISEVTDFSGEQGLLEVTVSDFGPGILSHFLSSSNGSYYGGYDKKDLLMLLVHENLTSRTVPGAGRGLPRVIRSAKSMRAYISLRTGAHWLSQSFADRQGGDTLQFVDQVCAEVAGSHWQILWPMIGL